MWNLQGDARPRHSQFAYSWGENPHSVSSGRLGVAVRALRKSETILQNHQDARHFLEHRQLRGAQEESLAESLPPAELLKVNTANQVAYKIL